MSQGYIEKELPGVSCEGGTRDRAAPGAGRGMRIFLKESRTNNAYDPEKFRANWRKALGLREVRDERGRVRTIYDPKEQKVWYDEFPIHEASRELLTGDFVDSLGNDKISGHGSMMLREAMAPVTASSQQDVNAYSIYIGGLIEQKFLQGYQLPDFWARDAVHTETTSVREQRITCQSNMSLPDKDTKEGVEYQNNGVVPRWIIRPPVIKYGQKASLTKEAVVFGLGGELLSAIEGGGKSLGYLEEYLIAATVMGKDIIAGTAGFMDGYTVNTYKYNAQPSDSPNATYQTAAGTGSSAKYNYVNKFSGTPLVSYQELAKARYQLSLMREPETNYPILANAKDLVVMPRYVDQTWAILHSTQIGPVFGSSGTTTAGTLGSQGGLQFSSPPPSNASLTLRSSAIWAKVLTDAGVTQANADLYWHIGDLKAAFGWAEVWPTKVQQANVLSTELVSADIVGLWVYSWFGCPYVRDARFNLQYTN